MKKRIFAFMLSLAIIASCFAFDITANAAGIYVNKSLDLSTTTLGDWTVSGTSSTVTCTDNVINLTRASTSTLTSITPVAFDSSNRLTSVNFDIQFGKTAIGSPIFYYYSYTDASNYSLIKFTRGDTTYTNGGIFHEVMSAGVKTTSAWVNQNLNWTDSTEFMHVYVQYSYSGSSIKCDIKTSGTATGTTMISYIPVTNQTVLNPVFALNSPSSTTSNTPVNYKNVKIGYGSNITNDLQTFFNNNPIVTASISEITAANAMAKMNALYAASVAYKTLSPEQQSGLVQQGYLANLNNQIIFAKSLLGIGNYQQSNLNLSTTTRADWLYTGDSSSDIITCADNVVSMAKTPIATSISPVALDSSNRLTNIDFDMQLSNISSSAPVYYYFSYIDANSYKALKFCRDGTYKGGIFLEEKNNGVADANNRWLSTNLNWADSTEYMHVNVKYAYSATGIKCTIATNGTATGTTITSKTLINNELVPNAIFSLNAPSTLQTANLTVKYKNIVITYDMDLLTYKKGDVNFDGYIGIVDLVTVKKRLLNLKTLTVNQSFVSDSNSDGAIDVNDLLNMKSILLRIE